MELEITRAQVSRLITAQLPEWSHLPLRQVVPGGWDNRTFRLGDDMLVRLPSAARYAAQVAKEQRWLPWLAAQGLPLPTPTPLAVGEPAMGYPWRWSVYRWIEGETVAAGQVDDMEALARALAEFQRALRSLDATEGPSPGAHNFFRGGPLSAYHDETMAAVEVLGDQLDAAAVCALWDDALSTAWTRAAVWVHGDVSSRNLLVRDGELSAVIDFGSSAVGDPACDLTIAWSFFEGGAREAFREAVAMDPDTWTRARGWALWRCLITLVERPDDAWARRVMKAVVFSFLFFVTV